MIHFLGQLALCLAEVYAVIYGVGFAVLGIEWVYGRV